MPSLHKLFARIMGNHGSGAVSTKIRRIELSVLIESEPQSSELYIYRGPYTGWFISDDLYRNP